MLALAFAAAALTVPPPPDLFIGRYEIEGRCASPESAYRGRLAIRREGLFHALTWQFDNGGAVVGTGLVREGVMYIHFRLAGGETGLMHVTRSDSGWFGEWAFFGSGEMCTERWTRA